MHTPEESLVTVLPVALILAAMSAYQIARLLIASRAIRRLHAASTVARDGFDPDKIRVLPFTLTSLTTSLFFGAGCGLLVMGATRCTSYIVNDPKMTWTEWLYISLLLLWPFSFLFLVTK